MGEGVRPFFSTKPSMTNHVNSRIVIPKLSVSYVYANFCHFPLEIFCLRISDCSGVHLNSQINVYYCLVITPWKCEYCLMWVRNKLNKLILFGSNSLKVWKCQYCITWTLKKSFYYSLVRKELSENVSITLEKFVVLFASNSLKILVLFHRNSGNVCSTVCQKLF